MPPLPLPLLLLLLSLASPPSASCSPQPPRTCSPSRGRCPPFPSPPAAFPFSASPGCNHPSFQIRCSSPHSLLSINSLPFLLLSLPRSPPNSLTLAPRLPPPPSPGCPPLASRPIDLSSSPFRLLSDPCARLASLCPTPPPPPSSCNLSSFQRRLLSSPHLLFPHCKPDPGPNCSGDASSALSAFLRSGFTVRWDLSADEYNSSCSACRRAADGVCGFNDTDSSKPFLCFPSLDRLDGDAHSSGRKLLVLVSTIFVAAAVCLFLVLGSLWFARRRCGGDAVWRRDPMASFLTRHQIHPPVYSYEQLRLATNGFDPRRKIGDGGFGSVFLAQLDDGWIAAVKRLHRQHPASTTKSFCNEILILSSLRHPNLVRLHGYCCDPRGLLLVYDYVPNGTLADHLHGSRSLYRKASLTWPVRVDIALQTASALEYLHFALKPPVVHRDITSSNIFVERDMRIKVGDFGLSRLLSLPDPNCSSGSSTEYVCCTGPQGTPGYLDPEYHRSFRLTEKSDVYSFGVVLLELVTGMKAVDLRRDKREVSLAEFVVSKIQVGALHEVVDPILVRGGNVMGNIEAVAELAFRCVAGEKDDRPNAREVVEELRRIKGLI